MVDTFYKSQTFSLAFVKVEPSVLEKSEKDLEADVSSMIEERLRLYNMNMNRRQDKQRCRGSGMFIPDPNFFHPGSWIRIKEFKYFNPKNCF
jgi:hypothetical protein